MEKVFDVVKLEARKMLSMWSAAQVELMFDALRHVASYWELTVASESLGSFANQVFRE